MRKAVYGGRSGEGVIVALLRGSSQKNRSIVSGTLWVIFTFPPHSFPALPLVSCVSMWDTKESLFTRLYCAIKPVIGARINVQNRGTEKLIGIVYFLYFLIYNITCNRTGILEIATQTYMFMKLTISKLETCAWSTRIHARLKNQNISAELKHDSESFILVADTTNYLVAQVRNFNYLSLGEAVRDYGKPEALCTQYTWPWISTLLTIYHQVGF